MPDCTSVIWISRMPGVSTSQPPEGSRWSVRPVVVCRPLASSSRMPRVAICSAPVSVLISVDLPTPDDPTSATVWPAPAPRGQLPDAGRVACIDRLDEEPGHQTGRFAREVFRCLRQVRLGQDDDRRDASLTRHRQIAFQACDVEVEIAGGDHEQRVDIGRDQLKLAAGAGGAALEQALSFKQALRAKRFRIEQQPVADGRGTFLAVCVKGRDVCRHVRADDLQVTAMDGRHARGGEIVEIIGFEL